VVTTPQLQACVEDVSASGALLELCLPGTWNGEILIWGHGYVNPGPDRPPFTPLALPSDEASGFPVKDIIRNVGTEAAGFFGYASTSYRRNGLVAPEAAVDLEETSVWIREQLQELAAAEGFDRLPVLRYLVGASEGGLATVLAAEESEAGAVFDGALALCAPVGDFRRQVEWFGDFRVIYDYYFPGIMPGSAIFIPDEETVITDENWAATEAAILEALDADPDAARELADATGVSRDAGDPQTLRDATTQILRYSFMGTNDAIGVLGGNPFGNQDTLYSGSSDDAALNAGVARHSADPSALAAIQATLQTSGRPTIPTVAMHTTRDPVTPIWHADLYVAKNAGATESVTLIPVDRFGHCGFTLPELLAGLSQLVVEVRDEPLVTWAGAFPTAEMRREFIGLTDIIGSRPVVVPSPQ
jgi:pimeloyl-ACP methyl ester carboxylesterase